MIRILVIDKIICTTSIISQLFYFERLDIHEVTTFNELCA